MAIIGIFLPLLPTTPFLLLASACFLRGSKTMHAWLRQTPLFGKILTEFEEHRTIPVRAKIIALLMIWPSMLFSMYMVQRLPLVIMLFAIAVGVSFYLLRFPSSIR
ncbi:YbaN family protein [Noviherbaspirillum saxi]|uniref:YbaN family protein n=1 Tax=Noviherbaspirillum saxi TaxID=2320863 RepID=UPI001F2EEC45|nr:YbaN family protein [Noviherbaspirillum saxi]